MLEILIVDSDPTNAFSIISSLGEGEVSTSFINHADRAISNILKKKYDLIIFGDRLEGGDTYDVGLMVKESSKNKHSKYVCIGAHISRAHKLNNLLGPNSIYIDLRDPASVEKARALVKQYKDASK